MADRDHSIAATKVDIPGTDQDEFCVITCHWNPANWQSSRRNYQRFMHEMAWWQVPTFSVEVAYEGQEWACDNTWLKIRAGKNNIIWQKERLLNLLVEKLPANFTKIAWVDADVLFLDAFWVQKTRKLLDEYSVAQIWNRWHCTGPNGEVAEALKSVDVNGARYTSREHCSPGGAWAANRNIFPIYDRHIVGSGDAMAVEAWIGIEYSRCMHQFTEAMRSDFTRWAIDAYAKVNGRIGIAEYDLVHLYHGSRRNRHYVDRWKPVVEFGFDPVKHVTVDAQGLLAWTPAAPPPLIAFVGNYFGSRAEDDYTTPYQII